MVKKEVEICDICKKIVAETKCEFCGADLCVSCKTYFGIGIEEKIMFVINSCENCNNVLQGIKNLEKEFDNCPNIRTELIETFKKLIQLEELEGKVKKKKPKKHDVFVSPLLNQFYPNRTTTTAPLKPFYQTPKGGSIFRRKKSEDHGFAWAASKAGKLMRYNYNDDEDDKA